MYGHGLYYSLDLHSKDLLQVYSVGGEKDVDKFEIFHSFSSAEEMDSDSIHTYQSTFTIVRNY